MVASTGKHPDGDDVLDSSQVAFISSVAELDGGAEFLSTPAEEWNYPQHRELISKSLLSLDHDARLSAMGGSDTAGGMVLEAAAMWEGEDPEYAAQLQAFAMDLHLDDNILIPAVKAEVGSGTSSKSETSKDDPKKDSEPESESKPFGDDQLKRLRKAWEDGGADGFKQVANEIRSENASKPLFSVEDDGKFPGPASANVGAFSESGDPADLTSKTDPPIKSLFS